MKKLNLNAIRIDGGTQSRVEISESAVMHYIECIEAGDEFPPVTVYWDGADYWLADGFHRWHAHNRLKRASVAADVVNGTRRDAVLRSFGANKNHGLPPNNADKRKVATAMLQDEEWGKWSDKRIAQECGFSVSFVGDMRRAIFSPTNDAPPAVRTVERAGKTYQQDTSKIGKARKEDASEARGVCEKPPKAPPPPPAPFPAPAQAEDDGAPSDEEIAAAQRAQEEELQSLRRIADSDDKLRAALDEAKRFREENRILKERVNSLLNEKNAAIQAAKRWEKKAKANERATV